jgi:lipid kinase YegS
MKSNETNRTLRIILNGKKAGLESIRSAVYQLRNRASEIEVRVTWEKGDGIRMVEEASRDGIARIVAAGGDGTLNEVVNGLMCLEPDKRPELALLPLGTANDFATACGIPLDPLASLRLAAEGGVKRVDVARANDRYFINVASGGFGAQVSAETPPMLKRYLGGVAYTLVAIFKLLTYAHRKGRLILEGIDLQGEAIAAAVCNGRQAGGGQMLAPEACIDDGMLDVMVIRPFPLRDIWRAFREIRHLDRPGKYLQHFRTRWIESHPHQIRSVNLDGEPYLAESIRFEVLPGEIELVLPERSPCLCVSDEERHTEGHRVAT